jgi:hypothetical protein
MTDEHYDYTKDEIKKQLALLELHGKNNPCPDCVRKHLATTEALSEEMTTMTDDEKEKLKYLELAEKTREMRKKLDETV